MSRVLSPLSFLAPWLAVLTACAAATIPYLSSLDAYFTGDDFGLVYLFSQKPPLHFLSLFWRPWTEQVYGPPLDELRPIVAASYQLGTLGGADSTVLYHLTNILLHLGCTVLVAGIARSICRLGWLASAFAGVVFAVIPSQAETVAWISGRADSIPAFLYLASFLSYVGWQRAQSRPLYLGAVGLFFLALFSKQSAITMPVTLILYDMVTARRWVLRSWSSGARYVPFVLLTAFYLGLRYVLFGNVIREQQITVESLVHVGLLQASFLKMLALGSHEVQTEGLGPPLVLVGLGLASLLSVFLLRRATQPDARRLWTAVFYFGPAWWVISVAPLAVTYASARHLYLASVGVAVLVAVCFDVAFVRAMWLGRFLVVMAGAGLVLWLAATLAQPVEEWNYAASISQQFASQVRREASTAPPGSLVILDLPASNYGYALTGRSQGDPAAWTWIWSWALPYAVQPPLTSSDLTHRVAIVESLAIYCCPPGEWLTSIQQAVGGWAREPERPPVIALLWDAPTRRLLRTSSADDPDLADAALRLGDAQTPDEATERLDFLLERLR